jgi:Domain of unknown function (DUF4167)
VYRLDRQRVGMRDRPLNGGLQLLDGRIGGEQPPQIGVGNRRHMRNGQNKRMRGRNRNQKSHHGGGGGGHHHHNPLTRVYESNGPDVKIRGTAHHIAEKYLQLARDAQTSGDPVTAENHFQHAEHYSRLIAAAQEQFRQQNPFYQAPPAPGESSRDESFDDDDAGQVTQNQPTQNPPVHSQQNFGSQQPLYPPREQPQPYSGQQQQQGRPQQQPYSQPPQYYQQPSNPEANDGERLPPFITGAQPQSSPQSFGPNGHDNQDGDRFPRHRRRRHRGGGGPRPDAPQDFRGDDGPDDSRPGNN